MTGSRPEAADAPSEELVRRAAHGDLAAFARIVRLHNEDMTRVAFVVTGDLDSAVRATEAAWPAAWGGIGRRRTPVDLGPWLASLAAKEAIPVARRERAPGTAGPVDHPADGEIERALARMDPGDRALLALRHVAGLSIADLASRDRRSRSPVAVRLARLTAGIGGPQLPGSDPVPVERWVRKRLVAYASVPIRPVDVDAAARRARAGEEFDRTQAISVAISVFVGVLVAGLPYLARLFHHS